MQKYAKKLICMSRRTPCTQGRGLQQISPADFPTGHNGPSQLAMHDLRKD